MPDSTLASLARAEQLHQKMVVVDAHHDVALDVLHRRQLAERSVLSGLWGKMLRAGGVDIQILPLSIDGSFLPELGLRILL